MLSVGKFVHNGFSFRAISGRALIVEVAVDLVIVPELDVFGLFRAATVHDFGTAGMEMTA